MKYLISELPEEKCEWGIAPKQWVVLCIKERDSDDQLLKDIIDTEQKRGIWAINNAIYFGDKKEITLFLLRHGVN